MKRKTILYTVVLLILLAAAAALLLMRKTIRTEEIQEAQVPAQETADLRDGAEAPESDEAAPEGGTEQIAAVPEAETAEPEPIPVTPEPEPEPEPEPVVHYSIPEDALAAPGPNEACYGTCSIDDPAPVVELIRRARESGLLGEDEVVAFDPEANFYHGSFARNFEYYLDDSIMVILWKESMDGMCCSFAEVKIADASQLRRKLADDTYGSQSQYYASVMAEQVNAVLTVNADYYLPRDYGIVVWNRELQRFNTGYVMEGCYQYNLVDTLFVTASGDFLILRQGEENTPESIETYVRENDILFSVAFGPALVLDGEAVPHTWYPVGEAMEGYSRAGIGQMGERHYLYMTLSHGNREARWNVNQFGEHFAQKPVQTAYCLDGGQTGEIYFCGSVYNYIDYNKERPVSDILYFATAVPESVSGGAAEAEPAAGGEAYDGEAGG